VIVSYYNNISIGAVALGATLAKCERLPMSNLFLVFPLVSHQSLLQYLGRKTTKSVSIEKLIAEKANYFSNFNKRYTDSLVLTLNALSFLHEMEYVRIEDGEVVLIKTFNYDKKMGSRAKKVFRAAENIALLLDENPGKLYLNLRVEL
jgi:hypothetical protein